MKQVVYIDVLFVLNMFINYLLLLLTVRLTHIEATRWRLLGGAALGGVYALLIFTPVIGVIYTLAAKLLFSLSIVLTAFKNLTPKKLVRALACFYGVNFAFAGAMLALWVTLNPRGMLMSNGIVYFNISVVTLVVTAVAVFFMLSIFSALNKRQSAGFQKYRVTLTLNGKTVSADALMDSGNTLSDVFSDTPVIVAEYAVVEGLFDESMKPFFKGGANTVIYSMSAEQSARIRLIPFSSMGGDGLLPAFRPDKIIITAPGALWQANRAFVAVCRGKLPSGDYGILLNPELIQENEKVVTVK